MRIIVNKLQLIFFVCQTWESIVYVYGEIGNGIFRIDVKVESTQILGIGFQHNF